MSAYDIFDLMMFEAARNYLFLFISTYYYADVYIEIYSRIISKSLKI